MTGPAPAARETQHSVITSYSIHYTKLYDTRTYMTRHGAGKFNTEVNKDVIGSNIIDMTNVPNEFQDTLRYGKLNLETMNRYISEDFDKAYYDTKKSLMITHRITSYNVCYTKLLR